jgi:hypothetical protein
VQAEQDVVAVTKNWTWDNEWSKYIARANQLIDEFCLLYEKNISIEDNRVQKVARENFEHSKVFLPNFTKEQRISSWNALKDVDFVKNLGTPKMHHELACYVADAMVFFANKNL